MPDNPAHVPTNALILCAYLCANTRDSFGLSHQRVNLSLYHKPPWLILLNWLVRSGGTSRDWSRVSCASAQHFTASCLPASPARPWVLVRQGVAAYQTGQAQLLLCVMAPPMVDPTWTRVHLTLGSDCLPTLCQGTALPLSHVSWTIVHMCMIRWSRWYRVVLVRCICLWAPEGCFLLPTRFACMVPCIPWQTTTFTIGGGHWDLHLLMLCGFPYDSITDSYCTWIAVLWPLVW